MKEYISKEDALKALCSTCGEEVSACGLCVEYSTIAKVCPADVRPVVQGMWIRRQSWSEGFGMGESYGFYWECSICGRQTKGDYDECGRNFCHNCGAKNE